MDPESASGDLLLTFDVGTTTVKTTLWDAGLEPLRIHRAEYPLTMTGSRIEVPPAVYADAVVAGARAVLGGVRTGAVAALALTTQGETLITTGPDGQPRGKAIVWLDDRAGAEAADLRSRLAEDEFYAATGVPRLDGTVPLAKAVQLDAHEAGSRLLLLEDYLVWWLTGTLVGNRALHTSTGWFDLRSDDYYEEALAAAGIDRRRLPELIGSGVPIGALRHERARELGLAPGTVVVSGAMDQAAAALGSGVDGAAGRVAASFGTALVVTAAAEAPLLDTVRRPTVYRGALDGSFLTVLIAPTSGALLRWLRDLFDDGTGRTRYADLDRLAALVPAGSDGVLALPSFEGGHGSDVAGRGAFLGLTLATGRGHLARSLLEATSYALRDMVGTLAGLGVTVDQLRTSGGGSQSRLWQQIAADVCGTPLTPLPFAEAASAGAALLAGWGAGLIETGTDPRRLDALERFLPRPDPAYADGYRRYREAREPLHPDRAARPGRSPRRKS